MNRLSLSLALLAIPAIPGFASFQEPQSDRAEEPVEGLRLRTAGAFEGYTLITPLRSRTTFLLDMQGDVVHRWESEHRPGNSVYLMDDGRLLRACRISDAPVLGGGGQGGMIQEYDWDGTVTWEFRYANEDYLQHHDIAPLPDGNTLICSGEQAWIFEVTRAGEIVWDYQNEHGWNPEEESSGRGGRDTRMHPKALFRATRIPLDHPGLAGKEL